LDLPFIEQATQQIQEADFKERLGRAYLYWTPHLWLALSAEYQYEWLRRDHDKIQTHRVPFGINFFHPSGFMTWLRPTYVNQTVNFFEPRTGRSIVVDAALGYRLPRRWGLLTLSVRNLFDQDLRFEDTDPANPTVFPQRLILARFTLAY
jgi:hypothetical protein